MSFRFSAANLWGERPLPHCGQHVFFILDGCRDLSEGKSRGMFVEMLKSDYREVRATLEAYLAQALIAGAEAATACGLGMSSSAPWNLTLRVTDALGTRDYRIDRWE